MSEWQPIETAPKDGRLILLCSVGPYRSEVTAGYYAADQAPFVWPHVDLDTNGCENRWNAWHEDYPPTHWQHLPAPPPKTEA